MNTFNNSEQQRRQRHKNKIMIETLPCIICNFKKPFKRKKNQVDLENKDKLILGGGI